MRATWGLGNGHAAFMVARRISDAADTANRSYCEACAKVPAWSDTLRDAETEQPRDVLTGAGGELCGRDVEYEPWKEAPDLEGAGGLNARITASSIGTAFALVADYVINLGNSFAYATLLVPLLIAIAALWWWALRPLAVYATFIGDGRHAYYNTHVGHFITGVTTVLVLVVVIYTINVTTASFVAVPLSTLGISIYFVINVILLASLVTRFIVPRP